MSTTPRSTNSLSTPGGSQSTIKNKKKYKRVRVNTYDFKHEEEGQNKTGYEESTCVFAKMNCCCKCMLCLITTIILLIIAGVLYFLILGTKDLSAGPMPRALVEFCFIKFFVFFILFFWMKKI